MSCMCCRKSASRDKYGIREVPGEDVTNGENDGVNRSSKGNKSQEVVARVKGETRETGTFSDVTNNTKHDNKGFSPSLHSNDLDQQIEAAVTIGSLSGETGMSRDMEAIASRLEAVATRLENVADRRASAANSDEMAEYVGAYEKIVAEHVQKFVTLSGKIGPLVSEQAGLVHDAFRAQSAFLRQVATCKQPDAALLQQLLKPTSDKIEAITELREKNRPSPLFKHLSVVSESIAALGWVTVLGKPGNYVKDMIDAGMFYGNKVIVDYKNTDTTHVDWVKNWMSLLGHLQEYARDYHPQGIIWNPKGKAASSSGSSPAPPPPPPGLPPPPIPSDASQKASSGDVDRSAMFAELNKGADVTKGLRKVTNDMKTHKNPALRQGSTVPATSSSKSPAPGKPTQTTTAVAKKPVLELDGKKWIVEHQVGNKSMMISDTDMRQTVYVYKCVDSMLQVKGKVNSITIDNCKKMALVLDDLVSGLEFVNCQSIQCQIMGKVATISIDKTDGCQVYLSKDSISTEIVTAKSSEMNILVPGNDGNFVEHALPEQFKSSFDGKKFQTGPTDINQ